MNNDGVTASPAPAAFFVSYTSADRAWAEWVAWQLEEAGYRTVIQAWDFLAGSNFVLEMQRAAASAERTILILSPAYLESRYAAPEWAAAFADDPQGHAGKLLPVRVAACQPDGLLGQRVWIDLVGLDEGAARRRLLAQVPRDRAKPATPPSFPGGAGGPHPFAAPRPFPGPQLVAPPSAPARRRSFVHAQVSAQGFLDLTPGVNPYAAPLDATDPDERLPAAGVFAFLWFPPCAYVRSSALQPFSPAAAVCVADPQAAGTRLAAAAGFAPALADVPPSKMRTEEKEASLEALAASLPDAFVAAVTIPDFVLAPARRRPELAYQVLVDLFLLPLAEAHRRLECAHFHARLASVGEATPTLQGLAKRALKAAYPRRDTSSVGLVQDNPREWQALAAAARLVAWAVGAAHNSDNSKWVSILERRLNPSGD